MQKTSNRLIWINAGVILLVALATWFLFRPKETRPGTMRAGEGHTLVFITEFAPNNFRIEEDGSFGGLQPELAALLFPDRKLHWLPAGTRREAVDALLSGKADVYASSVPLASGGGFEGTVATLPVYSTAFALIYPKGMDWMADFSRADGHVTIYGSEDDPAVSQIVRNMADLSYPSLSYAALPESGAEVALEVFRGRIKYALIEKKLAEEIAVTTGDSIEISTDLTFSSNQVWLVKAGRDSLLTTLNERIAEAKKIETYHKVIERNISKED